MARRGMMVSVLLLVASVPTFAQPVTLENVAAPSANSADEPLAAQFSLPQAARFLDSAALHWQKQRKCFTCHTNLAYLYARPGVSDDAPAHVEVRRFAEQLVETRWADQGPRWDAEVVAIAAALAFNDAASTDRLHSVTRKALDRMWTLQREDGGWDWLDCDWPPMESDEHYGVTLAAIAAGVAPDDYAATPAAAAGLAKVRSYLRTNKPANLHEQAMMVWAASYVAGILTEQEVAAIADQLLGLQHADGGWGLANFGSWPRADHTPQDTASSDGYGTGFAIFVLRRAGMPSDTPAITRGIAWLKTHQRASGRWFTRSLYKDGKHFISHAGSAMAVMALTEQ